MVDVRCMSCMGMYDDELDACPYCGFKESEYKKIGYHLPPHTILEDTYIVGRTLGYGGFGVTYAGYNAILDKKVAIKEYLPGEFATRNPGDTTVTAFTGDKEQAYYKGLEQFEQEAKRLARLKNKDGVVEIYDSFRANNTVYIVMECLEGETLKALLNRKKKLNIEEATEIIKAVLDALAEVHSENIIHRDISPENIFLTSDGRIKLIDFGAARNAITGLSKSLSVIIKQGYAPPEQYYSKGHQGTWTDVYAVAATYYKMITGITPDDSMERMEKDLLAPPSKLKIKLGKSRENALLNALELDADNRTVTAQEFLQGISAGNLKIKRTKAKKKNTDLGKMKLKTKLGIALGAMLVIVAFAIGYMVVRDNLVSDQESISENQVYVPNVLNMTYEDAENVLVENGLAVKVVKREMIDNMPPDIVVEQSVSVGNIVKKGTEIELVISNGGAQTYITSYVGLSFDEIITQLDEAEVFAEYTQVESVIAPGCVVSYDVPDYTNMAKGSLIHFEVSKGRSDYESELVEVPNLVGIQFSDSLSVLESKSLYVRITKNTYSTSVPKGEIISQNYKEGEFVSGKSIIDVEVSAGIEIIRMPDLSGIKLSKAKTILDELGLHYEVVYEPDGATGPCEVIRLSEAANSFVEKGSSVVIYAVRGVTIDGEILSPTNETENIYNIGDKIEIKILLSSENTVSPAYTYIDIGAKYDSEFLRLEKVEGAKETRNIEDDPNYGEMLAIRDSWTDAQYSNTITLTFIALKDGTTKFDIFTYITRDYGQEAEAWGNWGIDSTVEFEEGDEIIAETDDSVDIVIEKE